MQHGYSSCDDKVAARKRLTIYKAPRTLTVHLKRFSFKNGLINKIDKMITYKEQLDIRPYMTDGQQQSIHQIYNLSAVIVHSGPTTHSGHYVAYIKSSNGMWYCMNDASVCIYQESHSFLSSLIFFLNRYNKSAHRLCLIKRLIFCSMD